MRAAAFFVAAIVACGLLLPVRAATAQSVDPVAAVRAHYVAWNRVDREAVLATFAPGVVIDDNGTTYAGQEQVLAWVQRFVGPDQNLVLSNLRADGRRVTWEWTRLGDDARQRIGVPFTRGEGEAVIDGSGLIAYLAIRIDRAATPQLEAAYRAAVNQAFYAQVTQVAQRDREAAASAALPDRGASTPGQLVAAGAAAAACLALWAALKRPALQH